MLETDTAVDGLTDMEWAVLQVLDDEYVSATVVKWRAKLPNVQRIGPTLEACSRLEQLGLADRVGVGLGRRWRRSVR